LSRSTAQLTIARRYGFGSWPRLKRHVEVVNRLTRLPDEVAPIAEPVPEFLRLACLNYGNDDPDRWRSARRILDDHPEIPQASVHAAAAVADPAQVRRFLSGDGTLASSEGGPYRWEPLFYLAYARHDPDVPLRSVLEVARLLLAYGADPNAGYLWHGLPTPFTVLTGVFGEGELGPVRQPRHPHSLALARLLLEAGADANDGQALYNRMFRPDNDHLELLFEYGLGTGDGGPWRARLGHAVDSPAELLRGQLRWAVVHGMTARVPLLVAHGVDIASPYPDGYPPARLAALSGHPAISEYLMAHGAAEPDLVGVDAFVAAALAGDRTAVDRLRAADPGVVDAARAQRPGLIGWAAANRSTASAALLVELGFDVNAMARGDVPLEQPWQTALHTAVSEGDVRMVGLLLALGADPDRRDARFDSTPLGWARYFDNDELIRLLEPVTTDPSEAA
jgi:ankyrin repeat protein